MSDHCNAYLLRTLLGDLKRHEITIEGITDVPSDQVIVIGHKGYDYLYLLTKTKFVLAKLSWIGPYRPEIETIEIREYFLRVLPRQLERFAMHIDGLSDVTPAGVQVVIEDKFVRIQLRIGARTIIARLNRFDNVAPIVEEIADESN